jgi:hypothetical protein
MEAKRRANRGRALYADEPAPLRDHGLRDGEPEPGAAAILLRREKRIEDPCERARVHASAVVGDAYHDVLASRRCAVLLGEGFVEQLDVGAEVDEAPVATGRVGGVAHEVQDHLAQAHVVQAHERALGVERRLHAERPSRHGLDERHRISKEIVDDEAVRHHRLLSPIGQERASQVRRLLQGSLDGAEVFFVPLRVAPAFQHRNLRHHHHEQIVEVVCDARGEPPEAFDLRLLEQFRFEPRRSVTSRARLAVPEAFRPACGAHCSCTG